MQDVKTSTICNAQNIPLVFHEALLLWDRMLDLLANWDIVRSRRLPVQPIRHTNTQCNRVVEIGSEIFVCGI